MSERGIGVVVIVRNGVRETYDADDVVALQRENEALREEVFVKVAEVLSDGYVFWKEDVPEGTILYRKETDEEKRTRATPRA